MSIQKLATKFATGAWLQNVKEYFKKINEIIDYLNGTGTAGSGSYKKYVALLTQSGTSAPTVIVLENTLSGNPASSYFSQGRYRLTLTGAFPNANKVAILLGHTDGSSQLVASWVDANKIEVNTSDFAASFQNNLLFNDTIEIRVYN